MTAKHIAEHMQDLIDMTRIVRTAASAVNNPELGSYIQLAADEEIKRASDALHASWAALDRLRVIADRAADQRRRKPTKTKDPK